MDLTETEKAYLAGLFDGEGSVGYYLKTKANYHVAIAQISNCSPEIMEWLKAKIPFGSIAVTNNRKCNYTCWSWICNSRLQLREFLQMIRPYLVFKGKQVDLLFSLWDAEQEMGCKSGVKLSPETLELRNLTVVQLKRLKTASYKRVPIIDNLSEIGYPLTEELALRHQKG